MAISRLILYAIGLLASALAIAGYADFDPVTGAFDLHEINVYALAGLAGAGNLVAGIAWLTGAVGRKKK